MADPLTLLMLLEHGHQMELALAEAELDEDEKNELSHIWKSLKSRQESKFDAIINLIKQCDKQIGQLDKELGYSDESKNKALPFVSQYLGIYDQMFQQFRNKAYDKKPEYFMSSMWVNFQRQYEFNPPHDHDGCLSFVIYLSIPEKLKRTCSLQR